MENTLEQEIRSELAIYCDDHADVSIMDESCFILLENCEYGISIQRIIENALEDLQKLHVFKSIKLLEVDKHEENYDIGIIMVLNDWNQYQQKILDKHENYIRARRGLPPIKKPRVKSKHRHHKIRTDYRITKGGLCPKTKKQRYRLVGIKSEIITTSIDRQKLENILLKLVLNGE